MAENIGELSPWRTWPTLHRGVDNGKHGLDHLGQTPKPGSQPLWAVLKERGFKVGVYGSLHTYPVPSDFRDYCFFVTDVFSGSAVAHPAELESFQNLNLVMSRTSTRNVSREIPIKAILKYLAGTSILKIKPKTWKKIFSQLALEVSQPHLKSRRRTLQPVLAFDYFLNLLEAKKPHFSTFFTNNVASAMHRYWAALYPEQFKVKPDDDWIKKFKGEIFYAMSEVDEMLRSLMNFVNANEDYEVWIASSMGQGANEISRTPYCVAITDSFQFVQAIQPALRPKAAMFPNYNFEGETDIVQQALNRISRMRVNGQSVNASNKGEFLSVDFGQALLDPKEFRLEFDGQPANPFDFGLSVIEIEDEKGATAYHIPEGILQIYSPGILPLTKRSRLKATQIAPLLLSRFAANISAVDTYTEPNILAAQHDIGGNF